ncbi:MAG TPA: glycosyltransferase [Flavisolibacter sp.]|nr:glycosyltransferase [Flavisolibacter sp.]
MRILIIHCTYRFKGGEETVVSQEMKLLKAQGLEVELLSFSNERSALVNWLLLPFNPFSYNKVKKKLRSYRPHLVHVHNLHFAGSPSVLTAIRHSGIPYVMTLHNYRLLCPSATLFHQGKPFPHSLKQRFPWQAVRKAVYKRSHLLTFVMGLMVSLHDWLGTWRNCSAYIVFTDFAKELFLSSSRGFQPGRIVVKPNFSSGPDARPGSQAGSHFLYIGRLSEEKGIRTLLEAFAKVSYKIRIAGSGPLEAEVKAYSERYPHIEFIGVLKPEQVFAEMANGSALLFPSIWYEGMPLSIIEAFACGTPVIASELGAMKSMITAGYDGLHFEAGNAADLERCLEQWMNMEPAEKQHYRNNARRTYEKLYTPEKNIQALLDIYSSVLNDGKENAITLQAPAKSGSLAI